MFMRPLNTIYRMTHLQRFRKTFCRRRITSVFTLCLVLVFLCILLSSSTSMLSLLLQSRRSNFDLSFLTRTRHVEDYLANSLTPLIEPSIQPCADVEEVSLLVIVSSSPHNAEQRTAIRSTWGSLLKPYFIIGVLEKDNNDMLINNYVEAKQHNDLLVYDIVDSAANETLKTLLMLHWIQHRCPLAEMVLRTRDDVMVNPWLMKEYVIRERADDKLIGHLLKNTKVQRDPGKDGYIPDWLYSPDVIPSYLDGGAFLINGDVLKKIFAASFETPLINSEDVYITHLVSQNNLHYELKNDKRFCINQPTFAFVSCVYWNCATLIGTNGNSMYKIWDKIKYFGEKRDAGIGVCELYNKILYWFS